MTSTEPNCRRFRKLWQDQLDEEGRIPGAAPHLESCESCRTWVREMNCVLSDLDDLRALTSDVVSSRPAPPRLAGSGDTGVGGSTTRRRFRLWLPAAAALAASIVLALTLMPFGDRVSRLTDASGPPASSPTLGGADEDAADRDEGGSLADASGDAGAGREHSARELRESAAETGITLRGKSASQLMAVAQTHEVPGVAVYVLYQRVPRSTPMTRVGGS